jgi:hypothetical protein
MARFHGLVRSQCGIFPLPDLPSYDDPRTISGLAMRTRAALPPLPKAELAADQHVRVVGGDGFEPPTAAL